MVIVSHDIGVIARTCDEVVVMYAGKVLERGTVDEVLRRPRHPYTRMLLATVPSLVPNVSGRATRVHRRPAARSRHADRRLPLRAAMPAGPADLRDASGGAGPARGSPRVGLPVRLIHERPARRARPDQDLPATDERLGTGPAAARDDHDGRGWREPRRRPARDPWPRRGVGQRQDHPRALPRPARRARLRQRHLRRPGRVRGIGIAAAGHPSADAAHLPGSVLLAQPGHLGRGCDRRAGSGPRAGPARSTAAGAGRRPAGIGRPVADRTPTGGRASCPAGSGSGSPSRARWPSSPTCSSPTRRSARSMSRSRRRSSTCSPTSPRTGTWP